MSTSPTTVSSIIVDCAMTKLGVVSAGSCSAARIRIPDAQSHCTAQQVASVPNPTAEASRPIESQSIEPSPVNVAEAALQIKAEFTEFMPVFTTEQRKVIRALPITDSNGSTLGPPKGYHIPSRPITDPIASARNRPAFPDLKVPIPFVF